MWVCFNDGRHWQADEYPDETAARRALGAALHRDGSAGRTVTPATPVPDPDALYYVKAAGNLVGFYCLSPEHPAESTGSWAIYESP